MFRVKSRTLTMLVVVGVALLAGRAAAQDTRPSTGDFAGSLGALIGASCAHCHGGDQPDAGLDLGRFARDEAAFMTADAVRGSVLMRLSRGDMPPPEHERPDRALVAASIGWLTARAPGGTLDDEGRSPLRRLSTVEFANTVRDLFGVDRDLATELPADASGDGFDNNGDALRLPPLLFEKLATVADEIAAEAVVDEDPANPARRRFEAESMDNSLDPKEKERGKGNVAALFTRGRVSVDVTLPRDGRYVLRARAYATQAGPDTALMDFEVDHVREHEVKVPASKSAPGIYETTMTLPKGRRRLGVGFFHDFFDKEAPEGKRDRNLYVDWFEVVGPVDPPIPGGFHTRLLEAAGSGDTAARARRAMRWHLSRAWRRPPSDASVDAFAALVESAVERGLRFEGGLREAIAASMLSPRFLYRVEADPVNAQPGSMRPLDGWELASRLAYFLWSTTPDDALLGKAATGALATESGLLDVVRSMSSDARASALSANFAVQWLELRSLVDAAPDPLRYGVFDEPLRRAIAKETELLFEAVWRERRPARELLTADFTFVNERLARHYGIPGVRGDEHRRVVVPDPARRGLLGHASVHVLTSNPTRTSPVKRGKWVLSNLLDAPPPPPPPGVGALDESPEISASAPLKERLEKHRTDPSCASCHTRMDAVGFALENFDPVGRWRVTDGPHPVDASGTLPDNRVVRGPIALRDVLVEGPAFRRALAKKLFTYAVGRAPSPKDERFLTAWAESTTSEATIEDMVRAIVLSDAFRKKRVDG